MQGTRPPGQEIDPSPHQCHILSSLDMGHTLGLSKEEHVYEVRAYAPRLWGSQNARKHSWDKENWDKKMNPR